MKMDIELWPRVLYDAMEESTGKDMQLICCIQEMSELTKELTDYLRGKENPNIDEELGDVLINLKHLLILFDNHEGVQKSIDAKKCKTLNLICEGDFR